MLVGSMKIEISKGQLAKRFLLWCPFDICDVVTLQWFFTNQLLLWFYQNAHGQGNLIWVRLHIYSLQNFTGQILQSVIVMIKNLTNQIYRYELIWKKMSQKCSTGQLEIHLLNLVQKVSAFPKWNWIFKTSLGNSKV